MGVEQNQTINRVIQEKSLSINQIGYHRNSNLTIEFHVEN